MTNFIEYLLKDTSCLYIYNRNYSIYGLPDKERYTIIVNDGWVCPEDWIGFDTSIYEIYYLQQWFDLVTAGSLIGWECACLNKKYVIKEHVKLLMHSNPLQLRKDIDRLYNEDLVMSDINYDRYFSIIRAIRFTLQILDNHKIVNYRDGLDDCNKILEVKSMPEITEIIDHNYNQIKKVTDGVIKQDILNRAKKSGKI